IASIEINQTIGRRAIQEEVVAAAVDGERKEIGRNDPLREDQVAISVDGRPRSSGRFQREVFGHDRIEVVVFVYIGLRAATVRLEILTSQLAREQNPSVHLGGGGV